jgi:8-oxo-(d)GTP phosphatase
MKERTLILLRHAHRETTLGRDRDNGLSEKGKEQAKAIAKYYLGRFPDSSPVLLSSPKIRCVETLLPLADKTGRDIKVVDLLDEQFETNTAFQRRIAKFLQWWKKSQPSVLVVCSHGDWIPAFSRLFLGTAIELKKGGWLELESKSGVLRLRWVLQKVPR